MIQENHNFDFSAALKAIQEGKPPLGKEGILSPLQGQDASSILLLSFEFSMINRYPIASLEFGVSVCHPEDPAPAGR